MNIIHTSDWHLGHRLHEQSRYEEHALFLKWLTDIIISENIDILIIAGDIFDTAVPPSQSLRQYYNFLTNLRQTTCKHIFVLGGNHDAPGTLEAPKELLEVLQVHVVGKAEQEYENQIFEIDIDSEKFLLAAVPYLRDGDIRRALAGESYSDIGERYKFALVNHYGHLANICSERKFENTFCVATGHLFATGSSVSDSEQSIYVGNLGDISAEHFPVVFDYIALGHLHRAQIVGGNPKIRYSGSPLMLSFGETNQSKSILKIETVNGKLSEIKIIEIPQFRKLLRIEGTLVECITQLKTQTPDILKTWAELIIEDSAESEILMSEVSIQSSDIDVDILKITRKKTQQQFGLEKYTETHTDLKSLKPEDVFLLKCADAGIDIQEHPDLRDAFAELLQAVYEQKDGLD